MKKLLAYILAVCLALPLAACGGESAAPAQTEGAPSSQPEGAAAETTEAETLPPIPQGDFGGAEFSILAACEQWQNFYTADQTGDVVNDAVGIPAYVKNEEMSASITEAMQYYSEQTVKPAYFETAIKRKSTRDEESVEMLDIIGRTCASDFMYIFSRDIGDIINSIADKNYASKWAKNHDKFQKKIDALIETVKGL